MSDNLINSDRCDWSETVLRLVKTDDRQDLRLVGDWMSLLKLIIGQNRRQVGPQVGR